MTEAEIIQRLEASGDWRSGLRLAPYELLLGQAPEGALREIQTLMLVDEQRVPARGTTGRAWRPLLVIGSELLLDPDPRLLDRLLAAAGYWERPEAYGDPLLLQFHRFALDFYDGYQVREESFTRAADQLVVTGVATRGNLRDLQRFTYETRVGREDPAVFHVSPVEDLFD